MEEQQNQNQTQSWWSKINNYFVSLGRKKKIAVVILIGFIVVFDLIFFSIRIPNEFPVGGVFKITQGESLQSITVNLHSNHIIRSEFVFRSLVILFGGEKKVIAGDYLLGKKQGVLSLARRFVSGQFDISAKKITILEGWNVFEIADYLEKNILQFNKKEFIDLAKEKEGYLFPDTYFVSGSASPKEVLDMMENNFNKKIEGITDLASSTRSLKEILTIASILEEEAFPKDRAVVSGILWNRLNIDMLLQIDSTFKYINGKNTYELTLADLKIDSPYNTYVYNGLPPGPISNPGIDSILAALNPKKTKYLYFLSERNGTMHYGKTFEEHKRNKELYMK